MISSEAIVIGKRDWNEADRIVAFYSKKWGRIEALAKGIRKPKAKLRSHLELFCRLEISLVKAKGRPIIIDAVTINAFPGIKENLSSTRAAFALCEILDKGLVEQESSGVLWETVIGSFEFLNRVPSDKHVLIVGFLGLRVLDFLGYRPELYRCAVCSKELKSDLFFSPQNGGAAHRQCAPAPDSFPASANLIKLARIFLEKDVDFLAKLKVGALEKGELVNFLQTFFNYHLRENVESLKFL